MSAKVTFSFFQGREADQYSFYRIPKQLFTVDYFKGLSSDAKILYGLMLDRMSLSIKNQWFDDENRAYIYFSIEDVMEYLGCGKNKAIKSMKELDADGGIGLIEKRRQGFGRSNMIYVKHFLVEGVLPAIKEEGAVQAADNNYTNIENTNVNDPVGEKDYPIHIGDTIENTDIVSFKGSKEDMKYEKQTSVAGHLLKTPDTNTVNMDEETVLTGAETGSSWKNTLENDFLKANGPERHNDHPFFREEVPSKKDYEKSQKQTCSTPASKQEVYNVNFKKSLKQTSGSPKNKLQEVYKTNPNNTYENKTESIYNQSYQIVSMDPQTVADTEHCRHTRYECDKMQVKPGRTSDFPGISQCREIVRKNIELDILLEARPDDRELILEIYNLITEMLLSRNEEIVISSSRYPAEFVRSRFLKLNYNHIQYVADCLSRNTTKVKNIRKYLLASLFNAPVTIDGYYRAEANHDMPQIAGTYPS